ncbi:MAG: hypothetical protein ACK5N0_10240 [Synechococcaceae cyanobacterium]
MEMHEPSIHGGVGLKLHMGSDSALLVLSSQAVTVKRSFRRKQPLQWGIAISMVVLPLLFAPAQANEHVSSPPQLPRDGWKDCAFNGKVMGCTDTQLENGLRIIWKDGISMTYRERPPRQAGDPIYLSDRLGGLWRREVLAQGNLILTNLGNGNRIFVPLRFACKPPLKGEVGYCHY